MVSLYDTENKKGKFWHFIIIIIIITYECKCTHLSQTWVLLSYVTAPPTAKAK